MTNGKHRVVISVEIADDNIVQNSSRFLSLKIPGIMAEQWAIGWSPNLMSCSLPKQTKLITAYERLSTIVKSLIVISRALPTFKKSKKKKLKIYIAYYDQTKEDLMLGSNLTPKNWMTGEKKQIVIASCLINTLHIEASVTYRMESFNSEATSALKSENNSTVAKSHGNRKGLAFVKNRDKPTNEKNLNNLWLLNDAGQASKSTLPVSKQEENIPARLVKGCCAFICENKKHSYNAVIHENPYWPIFNLSRSIPRMANNYANRKIPLLDLLCTIHRDMENSRSNIDVFEKLIHDLQDTSKTLEL
ncbi:hypothetical protein ACOME3_009170 [Neoechinorhynchus agilis]